MKTLDTRGLQKRLEELEVERDSFVEQQVKNGGEEYEALQEWEYQNGAELSELEILKDEIGIKWNFGVILITEDDFEDYARYLIEDIGVIPRDAQWLLNCINWSQVIAELKVDYCEVEFQGLNYLYQA